MYIPDNTYLLKAFGTYPLKAGSTGVIPNSLILSNIFFCRTTDLECQLSDNGPPQPLRFPILNLKANSKLTPSFLWLEMVLAMKGKQVPRSAHQSPDLWGSYSYTLSSKHTLVRSSPVPSWRSSMPSSRCDVPIAPSSTRQSYSLSYTRSGST